MGYKTIFPIRLRKHFNRKEAGPACQSKQRLTGQCSQSHKFATFSSRQIPPYPIAGVFECNQPLTP